LKKILRGLLIALGVLGGLFAVFMLGMAWRLGLFDRMAFAGRYGSQTRGNLGAIRSALSIYYGDMEGVYPPALENLTDGGKYLTTLPLAQTRIHPDSNQVTPIDGQQNDARQIPDTGGWYYVTTGANQGNVGVACTHTDVKGSVWNAY
jgi:hypothetical protein